MGQWAGSRGWPHDLHQISSNVWKLIRFKAILIPLTERLSRNNPVKDLTLPDLACNTAGGTPMPQFVSVAAGDTVAFEWYHNTRGDDIIDASHKGPIQVYMAPYTETNGASGIWTKIASHSYDASTKKWAVDDLIANGGKHEFTVPSSIAPGKYLIRGEIIALHEADTNFEVNSARGAQFCTYHPSLPGTSRFFQPLC